MDREPRLTHVIAGKIDDLNRYRLLSFFFFFFFFSSRRRHTRSKRDWSSDVCSSNLPALCYHRPVLRRLRTMAAIHRLRIVGAGVLALSAVAAARQSPSRALSAADYAHAETFMTYNATPLVLRAGVRPTWLPDDRFWYRITTEKGSEAILIDPVNGTRAPCDLPSCAERADEGGRGGGRGGAAPRTDLPSPDGK